MKVNARVCVTKATSKNPNVTVRLRDDWLPPLLRTFTPLSELQTVAAAFEARILTPAVSATAANIFLPIRVRLIAPEAGPLDLLGEVNSKASNEILWVRVRVMSEPPESVAANALLPLLPVPTFETREVTEVQSEEKHWVPPTREDMDRLSERD